MTTPLVPTKAAHGRPCLPFEEVDRRTILGASEVAPVLGMSRFHSPLTVYLAKMQEEAQRIDRSASSGPALWGQRLEHAIRDAYESDILKTGVGLTVLSGDDIGTVLHPIHSWQAASPDGVVVHAGNPSEWLWGLECKNVDRSQAGRWGDIGTDEIPDEYALQCQWGMYVTGMDRWDVAALIGGNDFRVYTLRRDEDLVATVADAMEAFWFGHVMAKSAPAPLAQDNSLLSRILPNRSAEIVEGDPTIDELARRVAAARRDAEPYNDAVELSEALLKAAIGDRSGAVGVWGKALFRQNKPSTVTDWKAVAEALGAPEDVIAAHTTERAGARPFRLTLTGEV